MYKALPASSLSNLCFPRKESKDVCLRMRAHKFYEGNIHNGNKFIINFFLQEIYLKRTIYDVKHYKKAAKRQPVLSIPKNLPSQSYSS